MLTRELLAQVRRLEIRTRRLVEDLTGGAYHSVFKGRGIEFAEVREYVPGDDVRTIDWNVTARFGRPFIKQFVEERELTIMLLVDLSASTDTGSTRAKREQAAELAALLAFSALRNQDRVGLLLFSDVDELHLPPRRGRRQALRVIRELLAYTPRRRGTSLRHALEHFMRTNRRHTIAFLLSDFHDTGYQQALTSANQRHDVVAIRLLDRQEWEAQPGGWLAVEDAETGELVQVPTGPAWARTRYAAAATAANQEAVDACRRAGVDFIDLRVGGDPLRPLLRFFAQRGKRR